MALNAFATANTAAVTAGLSVLREQPSTQTLDVVVARQQGGCYCTDARLGIYPFLGAGCGC